MHSNNKVVVIGASAGGLKAIIDVLERLPRDFPVPIVVASHSGPEAQLPEVLNLQTQIGITIEEATDGITLEAGKAYILPGATHGLFVDKTLRLSPVVRKSGFRPSIDALFMTAAACFGPGTIAVVLSGTMNDGMRGAQVIYDVGGYTVVQDPDDAERAEMPQNVINADHPRKILSASDLGDWLTSALGRDA